MAYIRTFRGGQQFVPPTGLIVTAEVDAPETIPEGTPSDSWTVKQLEAYAERVGVDLPEGKKADKLAALLGDTDTTPAVIADDADEYPEYEA